MANTIFNSIKSFAEEIGKAVFERSGMESKVVLVTKNNGLVLTGLRFEREDTNISPTVYADDFFNKYNDEVLTFDEVVDKVIEIGSKEPDFSFDVNTYTDWETIKDRIKMKLVNLNQNKEILEDMPHMIYGDLAIIFNVKLSEPDIHGGTASIGIHNNHMEQWNKTTEDLYETAIANRDEVVVTSLFDTIMDIKGVDEEELEQMGYVLPPATGPLMYVASNSNKINGATCITDDDSLKNFAAEHGSFYVLPSSIHECIFLVPNGNAIEEDELNAMIQGINEYEVLPDEVLSDHAYYYDAETETLLDSLDGNEMTIKAA